MSDIPANDMARFMAPVGQSYPYIFVWSDKGCKWMGQRRAGMQFQRCRVLARGKMNSAMVEFENGQMDIISRNALRRAK